MTAAPLSVLVIDEDSLRASIIEAGLREADAAARVTIVSDMRGVARQIETTDPDVIVIDLENPNRDMLENIFQVTKALRRPIAMFIDRSDRETMESALDAGVSAYVVDGLRKNRVKPILDMAISRFNAYSRLTRELEDARDELEGRKVIDRAKGIIMRTKGISEEDAYALLRRSAMNQNRRIREIAQSLILAAGLLDE